MSFKLQSAVCAAALLLAACHSKPAEPLETDVASKSAAEAAPAAGEKAALAGATVLATAMPGKVKAAAVLKAAIQSEARPEADTERDASRLPYETLSFAGLKPGMTVLELEAGGGYFTEILSRTVGEKGKVIMQNPAAFDNFIKDGYDKRLGVERDRLPNVTLSKSDFDALEAEDGSVDLVTWIQGPHELWYSPSEGVSFGDPETAFAEIARVLKPGGKLLVVDHRAPDGTGPETGGDTHRIAQAHVDALAEGAGLKLKRSSDMLTRPDDDLTLNVFDDAVRGKTSQFAVLYKKPAE